jgi:hypothetical protein
LDEVEELGPDCLLCEVFDEVLAGAFCGMLVASFILLPVGVFEADGPRGCLWGVPFAGFAELVEWGVEAVRVGCF